MVRSAALLMVLILCADSQDYCYDEPDCALSGSFENGFESEEIVSDEDPYSWGNLFPSCHPLIERHQSPINLDHQMIRNDSLGPLHLKWFDTFQPGVWILENDGHSVLLQISSGMTVSGGGLPDVYHTIQLHFHWGGLATNGSEHMVDGRRYPMEMHIVNMKSIHPNVSAALDDPTGLAVLGFFIDVGFAENLHFRPITQKLSSVAYRGQTVRIKPFSLLNLLPKQNMSQYYRYSGSLTTPPCSQAVVWTIYEVPIYISRSQLAQFTSQIFSTEEDAEQVKPLKNNFRHIHSSFRHIVSASKDAGLLGGTAAQPLRSAWSVYVLQVIVLGSFICKL